MQGNRGEVEMKDCIVVGCRAVVVHPRERKRKK
jgi:hypothetical protein